MTTEVEWRGEIERAVADTLRAGIPELLYVATSADRGEEQPPASPYGLVALVPPSWKLLEDRGSVPNRIAKGETLVSVRLGVTSSDPVTQGARLGNQGLFDFAERSRKLLMGKPLVLPHTGEVNGVGAIWPTSYREEIPPYWTEVGTLELEQIYAVPFQLLSTAA